MTWERFHHICRRSVASRQADEPLVERLKEVEADPDTALYGKPLRPGTLPRRLLDRLVAHPDPNQARYLLELYASFNLATETPQPLQLKRIAIYLAYVSVLFIGVNALYQVKVMPHFTALYETFGVQTPDYVAIFRDYGGGVAVGVLLLIGLALVMGHVLKGLADGSVGWGRAGVARLLVRPKARTAYANLEAAILYPLGSEDGSSRVVSHLWKLEQEGVDLSQEIPALVRVQHRNLVELCETQMRRVYAFCVVLIVAMIIVFLASAYSPIFMMGDVV